MINRPTSSLRAQDVQLYTVSEHLTEILVYLMVVFSPWAFGTTQTWSIWTMNIAGFVLGGLLCLKVVVRHNKGYRAPRWDNKSALLSQAKSSDPQSGSSQLRRRALTAPRLVRVLAALSALTLVYCLISALNAAATYNPQSVEFIYHHHLRWLPHSFDSSRTWPVFWNYLALACAFWAIADWLPGKSGDEQRITRQATAPAALKPAPLFPARLRRLLWVLSINGAVLALEGILQRLEGSGRLLFLIKPVINPEAVAQFGPYHYRANAAAFLNLLWPVCLGFWWTLHRGAGLRKRQHHLLLLCGILMAAGPIISTSRGGALVTVAIILLAAFFFVATHFLLAAHQSENRRRRRATLTLLLLFFSGSLFLGLALGWKALKPRLREINEGFTGREEMFEAARPMTKDYPLFGTGPGTFETVFQLYRASTSTYWPAQLHNDWLETRITFGWFGSVLIGLSLLSVLLRWFARGGLHGGRRFIILMWLALGGCLLHARFDFPFQIYSILFTFLVLCAISFNLSRRP